MPLGGAGVDAEACDLHGGGGRVEVFVLQLAQEAAVHGIGEVAAKARHVEVVGAGADLLIGGEAQLDGAVGLVLPDDLRGGAEDLRHAGLVVAPRRVVPSVVMMVLPFCWSRAGKSLGDRVRPLVPRGDVAAVVVFDDLGG